MRSEDLLDEHTYNQVRTDQRVHERAKAAGLSRRRLLQILTAGAGAAAMGGTGLRAVDAQAPTDLVVKPTPQEFFYDLGSNKEMRWEVMYSRGYVVPNELFFVRDHSRSARLDAASWRLRVEGSGVSSPREFTYNEILALPSVSVMRFVECAGNGRSFFEAPYGKKAQGGQWKLGAIGVAEWTGVPLREVLDRAGLKRTAQDVMPEGLDELKVRRPMPIAKALADDTLLVYAMNGQTLPPDHGFPVRVLVPGWIGVANIKWVGRIEVSEQPLSSAWNTESYVLIGPGYNPTPPAKGPVLTLQNVKSAFELPWDTELPAGRRLLRGRSWSSHGKIAKVEVSLDREITWREARLREPNIAQAWTRWDLDWDARPGGYSLRARAIDERGNKQPAIVPWNDQGYLYGGVVGHPVTVR
jgi:DMSO/TMAO reductase YedYZ molybdopterin-dependent catalytic subunit